MLKKRLVLLLCSAAARVLSERLIVRTRQTKVAMCLGKSDGGTEFGQRRSLNLGISDGICRGRASSPIFSQFQLFQTIGRLATAAATAKV